MADISPYIPALNGEEIIQDACGALAEKLRTDCNLRPIDGYSGGYKATIKIHIEAFGLDTSNVDYEVNLNETRNDPSNPLQEPDDVIDLEFEIPIETDLSEVRRRSDQTATDFELKQPDEEITSEGPVAVPQPRRYSRRLKSLGVAKGGATESMAE